ncbi:hypothetical protein DYB37_013511, partial [Aphanomyces astaci]
MVQYQFIALAALAATAVTSKISVQVHRNLEVAKQSNVVVKFHCDDALATHRRRLKVGASRTETIESLVDSLKEHTTTSQASVKSLLANQIESTAVEVGTTWIDCSMYIDNAPTDLVQKIAALPEVKSIYESVVMELGETKSDDEPANVVVNEAIAWGVKKIQAPALWAKGIKGDGIVVANIDTGVRHTHESLKSNWRSEYGWFDPYNKSGVPNDAEGHGTHWREVGIIPVFPNGNDGLEGCAYSDYPAGSPHVIAVGNTDDNDSLAIDSSLGPFGKHRKPDISAPGVRIRSAEKFKDDSFSLKSGTSMSAPHVAGAIALYLSANKGASYDQVYKALTENADTDTLTPPDKTCGGIANTKYPNNLFGYGRLNIFNAVAADFPGLTLPPPSKSTQVLNPFNDLSTCGTLEVNTNYIGGDLTSVNLATAESCCAECKKTPGCKLFVWYTLNGGLCRLKDTQGPK